LSLERICLLLIQYHFECERPSTPVGIIFYEISDPANNKLKLRNSLLNSQSFSDTHFEQSKISLALTHYAADESKLTFISYQRHLVGKQFQIEKELYNFMVQDCQAFLPPLASTNVYFLRQVMRGEKEVCSSIDDSSFLKAYQAPNGYGVSCPSHRGTHSGRHSWDLQR
jgi:hypothetical protein